MTGRDILEAYSKPFVPTHKYITRDGAWGFVVAAGARFILLRSDFTAIGYVSSKDFNGVELYPLTELGKLLYL